MNLRYHKTFQKQYHKLLATQKKKVRQAVELFLIDPMAEKLYNHPLKSEWKDHRSIAAGHDLCIHYKELAPNTVLFVAVGTHSQLYK